MKIKNYKVHKLFLKENDRNYFLNDIKEYIKIYKRKSLIFQGDSLVLPKVKVDLIASKNGIDQLINKFHLSSSYIFLLNRIIGKKISLKIKPYIISFYFGNLYGIWKIILKAYMNNIISELTSSYISNTINDVINIFFSQKKNNNNMIDNDQLISKRLPRAFYDKFKYFKEFNEEHSNYLYLLHESIHNMKIELNFTNLVQEKNIIFIFTNVFLLMMTKDLEIYNTIYYYYIGKVSCSSNKINIDYNQIIDGSNFYQIIVDNNDIAKKIHLILNDEIMKNKDNFNDL
jgi:hypothetical protein